MQWWIWCLIMPTCFACIICYWSKSHVLWEQTIVHVLNNCPTFCLKGNKWQHNNVLSIIRNHNNDNVISEDCKRECDILDCSHNFVLDNVSSVLKPDICMCNMTNGNLFYLELTNSFKENMEEAYRLKEDKYWDLSEEAKQTYLMFATDVRASFLNHLSRCSITQLRRQKYLSPIFVRQSLALVICFGDKKKLC